MQNVKTSILLIQKAKEEYLRVYTNKCTDYLVMNKHLKLGALSIIYGMEGY